MSNLPLLHTPTLPCFAFVGENNPSLLGFLWLAYPGGFLKDVGSMRRDYMFPIPSPTAVLPKPEMLVEATILIMMAMVAMIMMMVEMNPMKLCYKTMAIVIITFARAQKWFQVLQPGKDPPSPLPWGAREKSNQQMLKGMPAGGPHHNTKPPSSKRRSPPQIFPSSHLHGQNSTWSFGELLRLQGRSEGRCKGSAGKGGDARL